MKQYWLRVAGAWFLLRIASALVRDTEKLLQRAADHKPHLEVVSDDTPDEEVTDASAS